MLAALPSRVDLRMGAVALPPVQDQGELNSCTAHVLAAAVQHARPGDPAPSRLFIYYNERADEGTLGHDPHGRPVQMRDGLRTVAGQGVCPEELWPYDA